MTEKIDPLFIRWSIVIEYIKASYKPVDSNNLPYMDADSANYWASYILTGKSHKQLEQEQIKNKDDD